MPPSTNAHRGMAPELVSEEESVLESVGMGSSGVAQRVLLKGVQGRRRPKAQVDCREASQLRCRKSSEEAERKQTDRVLSSDNAGIQEFTSARHVRQTLLLIPSQTVLAYMPCMHEPLRKRAASGWRLTVTADRQAKICNLARKQAS